MKRRALLPVLIVFLVNDVTSIRRLPTTPGYPVIIIPGMAGSKLEGRLTGKPEVVNFLCETSSNLYFPLWMSPLNFLPFFFDCWQDNMRLVFDNTTKSSHNGPGVDVRVPNFGDTSSLEWAEPYQAALSRNDLVDTLVKWGYTRGKDVAGAPYDFRLAANEQSHFFQQLKNLTEQLYRSNGNKRVVVVAHSMGNIMFKHFIDHIVDAEWKAKFLRSFVSIAAPWGGAIQTVQMYASGFPFPLSSPLKARPMVRSFTSSAQLFPNMAAWNSSEIFAIDKKTNKTYSTANVREFFTDIDYELGWEQYQVARFHGHVRAPDVETHCIYGFGVETPERYEWAAGDFPDRLPRAQAGDGDGNVNRQSAEVCLNWQAGAASSKVRITARGIAGLDHLALRKDRQVMQHVRQVLYDEF